MISAVIRRSIALAFPPGILYQPGGYNVDAIVASYIASGGNLRPNPLYTTPNSFQGRREMRLEGESASSANSSG